MESEHTSPILTFPTWFPLKIFTIFEETIDEQVFKVLKSFFPELDKNEIVEKISGAGNYISFTANLVIESENQLQTIYQALMAIPNVVMVL